MNPRIYRPILGVLLLLLLAQVSRLGCTAMRHREEARLRAINDRSVAELKSLLLRSAFVNEYGQRITFREGHVHIKGRKTHIGYEVDAGGINLDDSRPWSKSDRKRGHRLRQDYRPDALSEIARYRGTLSWSSNNCFVGTQNYGRIRHTYRVLTPELERSWRDQRTNNTVAMCGAIDRLVACTQRIRGNIEAQVETGRAVLQQVSFDAGKTLEALPPLDIVCHFPSEDDAALARTSTWTIQARVALANHNYDRQTINNYASPRNVLALVHMNDQPSGKGCGFVLHTKFSTARVVLRDFDQLPQSTKPILYWRKRKSSAGSYVGDGPVAGHTAWDTEISLCLLDQVDGAVLGTRVFSRAAPERIVMHTRSDNVFGGQDTFMKTEGGGPVGTPVGKWVREHNPWLPFDFENRGGLEIAVDLRTGESSLGQPDAAWATCVWPPQNKSLIP